MNQPNPPLCLSCGKPVFRKGRMVEMHVNSDVNCMTTMCMFCCALWRMEKSGENWTLVELTPEERTDAEKILAPYIKTQTEKHDFCKARGIAFETYLAFEDSLPKPKPEFNA